MAPTLVASYAITPAAQNLNTLTTPSFTPSNGEVLVVKLFAWGLTAAMGAPTGGSQTYTSRPASSAGGTFPAVSIYTAVVAGSPGAMTVSSTPAQSSYHAMVVERWGSATLAGSPAVVNTSGSSTTVSTTITTVAANSIVSWASGDGSSKDPATRAYLSSATEDGLLDGHIGSNSVGYFAYQTAASAGSQTLGLSAPTPQSWTLVGIEVQDAGGTTTPVSGADTGSGVDAAAVAVSLAAADTGAGVDVGALVAATSVADTGSGADAASVVVLVSVADTGSAVDATPARSLTAADVVSGVDATPARTLTAFDTLLAADAATVFNGQSTDITVNVGQPRRGWFASAPVSGWSVSPPARRWSAGKPTI